MPRVSVRTASGPYIRGQRVRVLFWTCEDRPIGFFRRVSCGQASFPKEAVR